jgi:predicted 2-oxoglutarate/Fe(II)-dependent dioxygenase YbiX
MIVVEPGIGYPGGYFAPYKVWESYAVYHAYLSSSKVRNCFVDAKEWESDVIIPNYYAPDELEFSSTKDDYFLFVGRIGTAKGVDYAIEMTRRIGAKLVVAGQNVEEGLKEVNLWPPPPHVEIIGYIDLEQKKKLMSKAKAVICFSKYVEPFCAVHAEALLSGTPVISSDWGAFVEFVLHGITGFRCRNMDQMVKAAQSVHKIDPEVCRAWALKKFSYDAVAAKYEEYFQSIQMNGEFDQFQPHYLPALTDARVDDIRKRLEGVALQDASVGTDNQVNHSTRRTKIFWIPKTDEFADLYTYILDSIGKANETHYKFQVTGINDSIQYSVYTGEDQGYYDWHIDAMRNHKRKISAVIQLSDPSEYEGGELHLQNGGVSVVEKTKGTFIIFPSWMTHKVTPVTKGIRKTLVLWVDGPAFV